MKTSPNTKVTISELIIRTDDETLNDKIKHINTLLRQNCAADNILLEHSDINNDCLIQSGVHLNKKGISLFALSVIKGLVSGSCIAGFCYCLHFTQIQQIAIKIPCLEHF